MSGYIARRVMSLIPTLLGVSVIVFLFLRLIPGDPATAFLRESATSDQVAAFNERLGLNKPLPEQYATYMAKVLHGDLGTGLHSGLPVSDEIKRKFPATAELGLAAMLIATVVGIFLGVVAAIRRASVLDYGTTTAALIGVSMPIFWLGLMLIYLFAVNLHWLPPSTRGEPPERLVTGLYSIDYLLNADPAGWVEALRHLLLPAAVLATVPLAVVARQTRSAMLEVLSQDFVRTAWSKGLRERAVVTRHVLKNALLPVVTIVGLQVGALLSGAVLTEQVFSWPGMGSYIVEAINSRDYPIVQGSILFLATIFVVINLLVDISYAWLDPRIRYR